jgi:hypothetical protein
MNIFKDFELVFKVPAAIHLTLLELILRMKSQAR